MSLLAGPAWKRLDVANFQGVYYCCVDARRMLCARHISFWLDVQSGHSPRSFAALPDADPP